MPSGENIWNKLLRDNRRMRKGDLGKLQRKLWFCIEAAETGLRGAMQEDNGEEIRRWLHVTSQLAAVYSKVVIDSDLEQRIKLLEDARK
jgi:hypothetical protein